jgi:hypothetical protein
MSKNVILVIIIPVKEVTGNARGLAYWNNETARLLWRSYECVHSRWPAFCLPL